MWKNGFSREYESNSESTTMNSKVTVEVVDKQTTDFALIVSGSDPQSIADALYEELESCRQWLMDNKLSLHSGKTESILVGSKRKLKKVESLC